MKNLWDSEQASKVENDLLALRVYTSRLLGRDDSLVLHGGGNTSVKGNEINIFGETEEILYVKGSGWDLKTIEKEGFSPVGLKKLLRLAALPALTDSQMVKEQRAALTNPFAPNPSVEAILHALIPYRFVDHTHADAVVTLTNNPAGEDLIKTLYGETLLIVPYVMAGFQLAKLIYDLTENLDWSSINGMILMHHGVFTFSHDAKESYDNMIDIVSKAEDFIQQKNPVLQKKETSAAVDLSALAQLRKAVATLRGNPVLACLNNSPAAVGFASWQPGIKLALGGTVTPDHVIHTKPFPLVVDEDIVQSVDKYSEKYQAYFKTYQTGQTCLTTDPSWAIWPDKGIVTFGETLAKSNIIRDITSHTMQAIQWGEAIGGWQPLPNKDLFEIEYWELEQAKLKKQTAAGNYQGKIAVVTGAASGIGRACVLELNQLGAAVIALDINPDIEIMYDQPTVLGIRCDANDPDRLRESIAQGVLTYGGIDLVVSNVGFFPKSEKIEHVTADNWQNSLDLNLTSHKNLFQLTIPFLKAGIDPAIIIVGSKNVRAPGPGAAAYSVAKAGLTQLSRVAALELGSYGIRVNVVHPDAVFDTALWNDAILKSRADSYGISVEQYKRKNLLQTQIASSDVARVVASLASSVFSKTTGAQIPLDGGNDRVI